MAANEKSEVKEDLVEAIVARGRTIHDQTKKASEGGEPLLYTENQTVRLPAADVARLRKTGYLKPEVEPVDVQLGPRLTGGQVAVTKTS